MPVYCVLNTVSALDQLRSELELKFALKFLPHLGIFSQAPRLEQLFEVQIPTRIATHRSVAS